MQKDVFAASVSVKLSLEKKKKRSTHKMLVVSDLLLAKLCFHAATIFIFAEKFLSMCWSFTLHSQKEKIEKKSKAGIVIYETVLPGDKYL